MKNVLLAITAFIFLLFLQQKSFNSEKELNASDYDDKEPITGFKRVIKFEINKKQLNIPYGYLSNLSMKNGTLWPSNEHKVYQGDSMEINVYADWSTGNIHLLPYNQKTKKHFQKSWPAGLMSNVILIQDKCKINIENYKNNLNSFGYKKIYSSNIEYEAWERRNPEIPRVHQIDYLKFGDNPLIINQVHEDNGIYNYIVGFCFNGLGISYYPSMRDKRLNTQDEIFQYQSEVERIISSFFN